MVLVLCIANLHWGPYNHILTVSLTAAGNIPNPLPQACRGEPHGDSGRRCVDLVEVWLHPPPVPCYQLYTHAGPWHCSVCSQSPWWGVIMIAWFGSCSHVKQLQSSLLPLSSLSSGYYTEIHPLFLFHARDKVQMHILMHPMSICTHIKITCNQPTTLTSTFDTWDASYIENAPCYIHCHSDLFTVWLQ